MSAVDIACILSSVRLYFYARKKVTFMILLRDEGTFQTGEVLTGTGWGDLRERTRKYMGRQY
jgi:hypothetical protein